MDGISILHQILLLYSRKQIDCTKSKQVQVWAFSKKIANTCEICLSHTQTLVLVSHYSRSVFLRVSLQLVMHLYLLLSLPVLKKAYNILKSRASFFSDKLICQFVCFVEFFSFILLS